MTAFATPDKSKPITDVNGDFCPRATTDSYPLYATCVLCHTGIKCADGTADWLHLSDDRPTCSTIENLKEASK